MGLLVYRTSRKILPQILFQIKLKLWLLSCLLLIPVANFEIFANGSQKIIHQVKSGENLTAIAKRYRIEVEDIVAWNSLKNANTIYRGQRLKILLVDSAKDSEESNSKQSQHKNQKERNGKKVVDFFMPSPSIRVLSSFEAGGDERRYGILCLVGKSGEIFAASQGKIAKTGFLRGYGKFIIVDHSNGWLTMYSNLSDIMVKPGQSVDRNAAMATADNRRLFFVVSYKGKPLNPLALVQNKFS